MENNIYTPTEHPTIPERVLSETYMVNGKEYTVGGEFYRPKDIENKTILLFRDLDPQHDIYVKKDSL